MIARIGRELREHGADTEALFWERAYWGDILQSHQNELLNAKLKYSKLNWMWLRHFVIDNLGDAVAYQRDPTDPENFYSQIHRRIHEKIVELRGRLGHDGLLVIMAHSLGSYIISNYIWDRQKPMKYIPESNRPAEEEYRGTPFECMDTLATLITFGSNIAIFSLALDPYVGITFPPERLAAPFQPLARWLNSMIPMMFWAIPSNHCVPSTATIRASKTVWSMPVAYSRAGIHSRMIDIGPTPISLNPWQIKSRNCCNGCNGLQPFILISSISPDGWA